VGLPDIVEKERYNTRQQSRLKKVIKYRLSRNKVFWSGIVMLEAVRRA
jgi:hypothetical protein